MPSGAALGPVQLLPADRLVQGSLDRGHVRARVLGELLGGRLSAAVMPTAQGKGGQDVPLGQGLDLQVPLRPAGQRAAHGVPLVG
jgi:hypothetical protein